MIKLIVFVIVAFAATNATATNLETISDDDLLTLIKQEKYVVTLFCKFFQCFGAHIFLSIQYRRPEFQVC